MAQSASKPDPGERPLLVRFTPRRDRDRLFGPASEIGLETNRLITHAKTCCDRKLCGRLYQRTVRDRFAAANRRQGIGEGVLDALQPNKQRDVGTTLFVANTPHGNFTVSLYDGRDIGLQSVQLTWRLPSRLGGAVEGRKGDLA